MPAMPSKTISTQITMITVTITSSMRMIVAKGSPIGMSASNCCAPQKITPKNDEYEDQS